MPIINKGIFDTNDAFLRQTGNDWPTAQIISTSDVVESTSNLYFTNARVASNVATLMKSFQGFGLTIDPANGQINIAATSSVGTANVSNFASTANVANTVISLAGHTTSEIIEGSNLYYTDARVNVAIRPILTTANVIETSSNLYFTNARVIAALSNATIVGNLYITGLLSANTLVIRGIDVTNNVTANNVSASTFSGNSLTVDSITSNTWNRLYTANVIETAGNLYFTTARVNATVQPFLTTANVIETSGNLYYTDARVNVTIRPILTTANVIETAGNLYFTTARVAANVITLMKSFQGSGLTIDAANGQINIATSGSTPQANTATTANTVLSLANFTTANLAEGVNLYYTNARVIATVTPTHTTANIIETSANLYFTNTRARAAFTAGRGIIIMDDGTLKSTVGTYNFDTTISGAQDYTVTSAMAGITFSPPNSTDRIILRSLHVTNISDNTAYVSSNVLYAAGNTAYMGNLIPVPVGGIVEFIHRNQVLQPNDKVNLQGFNQNLTPTSNILHSYFTYEIVTSDITYNGTGQNLATSNTNIQIITADQSDVVIESVKFVNLKSYSIPIKLYIGSANNAPKAYLAYNLQVPPSSSMEVLQSPKLMKYLDNMYASYANASDGDSISVFPSYRRSAVTTLTGQTTSAVSQQTLSASFQTTLSDGTTLYYTLE
jgi:hypothetical protein